MRADARSGGSRRRLFAFLVAGAGLALLIAANAHLLHVAFDTQPECVSHGKERGGPGAYRAARSAC